ncbi:unnamed protein product [Boreogadus saida]
MSSCAAADSLLMPSLLEETPPLVGYSHMKSMNRDMEKKGIVLRELSCRTASELPAPKLLDYSLAAVEAIRPQSGSSGGVLRELNWRRCWMAAPVD